MPRARWAKPSPVLPGVELVSGHAATSAVSLLLAGHLAALRGPGGYSVWVESLRGPSGPSSGSDPEGTN